MANLTSYDQHSRTSSGKSGMPKSVDFLLKNIASSPNPPQSTDQPPTIPDRAALMLFRLELDSGVSSPDRNEPGKVWEIRR